MPAIDFEGLFRNSPNAYVLLDADMVIVAANAAYLAATGRTREAIEGKTVFEAFPSDPDSPSYRQLKASLERAISEGETDHLPAIRYDIALPDGRGRDVRYWSTTHTPLLDESGETVYVLQHTEDITELHRLRSAARTMEGHVPASVESNIMSRAEAMQAAVDELGQELDRFQKLFEQAPGFVAILTGPKHVFTLANAAYYQVIGHREIIGKPVREALPEVAGQGFVELLDKVYSSGEPFVGRRMSVDIRPTPDDAPIERRLDFVYQPIRGASHETMGIFVQGSEVTDQHAAEERLRQLNETLEARVAEEINERRHAEMALQHAQKMEAIGELTGGVAHDFNNLLQVISGNLQLLRKDTPDDGRSRRRIDNALAGVERGARLAGQLLAFGRRQPLEPKSLNVGCLVSSVADMLRRVLGETIEVETEVAESVWNTLIDPNQMENALLNLAINARDAMPEGGRLTISVANVPIDATFSARHDVVSPGDYVAVRVGDTGTGMPEDIIDKVFDPFFSTKPEGKGTGLGLSMVYGFIKQSGGHVEIESRLGEGTRINLYLPRTHLREDARAEAGSGPISGGTETILVAEDDMEVRVTVVEMLSDLGYRVLEADNAARAIEVIESGETIDLLLSDVVMPGPVKSPELARAAREAIPGLAVLFTSGYTEDAIMHDGRLDPGIELLSKPYSRETLARRVRRLLDARQAERGEGEGVSAQARGSETAVEQTPLSILFVEDEPLIRMATADMIRDLGHIVHECGDASSALRVLDTTSPDVILTDVGLPDSSGVDLAQQARGLNAGIAVVLATGHRISLDQAPIGTVLLDKPYDQHGIAYALETALGRDRR